MVNRVSSLHWLKIYTDFRICFERRQKDNRLSNVSYTEKYQEHIPCSFVYKFVCIDDKFDEPVVFYRGQKMRSIRLSHELLMTIDIVKRW